MSKIKKKITVRFFSIDTDSEFFDDFVSAYNANLTNEKPIRIFNIRDKKHLIKIYPPMEHCEQQIFFLSVVKERITWQARAFVDGTISAIHTNQGLIGDLYYYLVVPSLKSILGFTTGPTSSVRSVANTVLQQFKKDRTSKISLEPSTHENEYTKLQDLAEFTEVRFRLAPSMLSDYTDDMPNIFRELKASSFLSNSPNLELTISIPQTNDGGFSQEDLMGIIDYLADSESCTALIIKGINHGGEKLQLNFNNTYVAYSTDASLRGNFIDEELAKTIILKALNYQKTL